MKDAAVIVGVLVELNHVIHSCSMGWFDLFFKALLFTSGLINSIPNCLFVLHPLVHSRMCRSLVGGKGGKMYCSSFISNLLF